MSFRTTTQAAEYSQELVPPLSDLFNSEYVYRRYRQSSGFCLAVATAACWYGAQLDAPQWSACAKAFLSPIHEVFPYTCQLLGSLLERPARLAVVTKAPRTNAVRDLTEPYATELARAVCNGIGTSRTPNHDRMCQYVAKG